LTLLFFLLAVAMATGVVDLPKAAPGAVLGLEPPWPPNAKAPPAIDRTSAANAIAVLACMCRTIREIMFAFRLLTMRRPDKPPSAARADPRFLGSVAWIGR